MKKVISIVLMATALMTGFTGCGQSSQANQSTDAKKDKVSIGCAIYKFDDTFMTGVRNAISDAAKDKANVEIVDSQNSQTTQNDKIDLVYNKESK